MPAGANPAKEIVGSDKAAIIDQSVLPWSVFNRSKNILTL
jgi:hypothetical protein